MTFTESPTGTQHDLVAEHPAFDAFYTQRRNGMIHLATGLVDHRSVAEEIVQEAFQRVWLRWDELSCPAVYLRTIVVNRCNDELRRRRVRRSAMREIRPDSGDEPLYLADVLSEIAPRRRTALVLRYYGGHTVPEVAQAMDIPTGTAKSLIHRGLADMRGALN